VNEPENESSPGKSDWKGSESVGDFERSIPRDDEWHNVSIDGTGYQVKYFGTFGYIDLDKEDGWSR
jgi:hypothetical protein